VNGSIGNTSLENLHPWQPLRVGQVVRFDNILLCGLFDREMESIDEGDQVLAYYQHTVDDDPWFYQVEWATFVACDNAVLSAIVYI
jgi:hypothetical protein